MLLKFAVQNFKSFKDMTEFSMIASKVQRHRDHVEICDNHRVLKGSFLFGANASGKSNFVEAIAFAVKIIHYGLQNVNINKKYFRIDNEYQNKPGVFQFDFFINNKFYSYGFAISYLDGTVEEEWLYEISEKPEKEICVFHRSKENNKYQINTELAFEKDETKIKFDVYMKDFENINMGTTLFLTDIFKRANEEESEFIPFIDTVEWFDKIIVIFPYSFYSRVEEFISDLNQKKKTEMLLKYFDTGIESVEEVEIDFEKLLSNMPPEKADEMMINLNKKLPDENSKVVVRHSFDGTLAEISKRGNVIIAKKVSSNHGNNNDLFERIDESDGTKRLFDLIPIFEKAKNDCIIIVDELDRSFHTKLSEEFIKHFYVVAKDKKSQLIITTHDTNLLNLDNIRQDEIWFVDRQEDHSSKIYSLSQFKQRFDKDIEKDYLLGRYGAVPMFDSLFQEIGFQDDGGELKSE